MGKGGKRPVYDFLMSIDYGVCHGPVDSINVIYVKDKPIFCGNIPDDASVITVYQPDLFGGDDAEGGVEGAVELYLGTDDQTASEALASRFGFTSATFPGYVGVCHMFFRGAAGALPGAEIAEGKDEIDAATVSRDNGEGFKWTANNPYLPEVKVNLSRYPKTLSEINHIVPAIGGVEDDGAGNLTYTDSDVTISLSEDDFVIVGLPLSYGINNGPAPSPASSDALVVEQPLLSLGMTEEVIDLGGADITIGWSGTPTGAGTAGAIFMIRVGFYPDDGFGGADTANGIDGQDEFGQPFSGFLNRQTGGVVDGNKSVLILNCPIPAGTRHIRYSAGVVFTIPFTAGLSGIDRDTNREVRFTDAEIEYTYCQVDGTIDGLPDANPSHIIHECLVDKEWGKGEDPSLIDTSAFQAMADTLYEERFGLSMIWSRQDTVQNIVQDVLDHIKGFLFISPISGLWTPKLMRDDYDAAAAPLFDETNCKATKRKRKVWGETINEIIVSWTDPNTEEAATTGAQDEGNISIQGGQIISETREYSGIRNAFLAKIVAERDVREAAYPLYSCILEVDRNAWSILPGDVVRFSWAEDGLVEMVMRVMKINYGSPKDRTIKLNVVEDIFALESAQYTAIADTALPDDRRLPIPFDNEFAMTVPLPLLQQTGVDVEDLDADYPDVAVMLHGDHDDINAIDFQMHTTVTLGTGGTAIQSVGTSNKQETRLTTAALVPEVLSRLPLAVVDGVTFGTATEGQVLMLGNSEASHEFVMLTQYVALDEEWEIARGIWDTLPGTWPVGTILWQLDGDGSAFDTSARAAGEVRTYRLLPRTSVGRLAYSEAADLTITVSERPHRPFRPANTQLDGQGFTPLNEVNLDTPGQMTATWANRNRALEDAVYQKWSDPNVGGEAGQDTTIKVFDLADSLVIEYTGEVGTSKVIPFTDLGATTQGYVEFVAVNAVGESLWNAKRYFDIRGGDMSSTVITMDETTTTMDRT